MLYEMSMAPEVLMLFNSINLNKATESAAKHLFSHQPDSCSTDLSKWLHNSFLLFFFFFLQKLQQCPKCEILMLQSEQTTKTLDEI